MHIRHWIFFGIIVLVAGYFVFEARGVHFAPSLEIFEPKNESKVSGSRLRIAGRTDPRLKVWIEGREVESDERGIFEDNMPIWPGYSEIGISIKDKFGNETRKILKVIAE